MHITKILADLPNKRETVKTLEQYQTVSDIKTAMQNRLRQDFEDYKAICFYFVGRSPYQTCKNIWNFLRRNVRNVTETDKRQTVKSPYNILIQGLNVGGDCKHYALFAGGILNALIVQKVIPGNVYWRFAEYENGIGGASNHVLTVYENNGEKFFIDCIKEIDTFNMQLEPTRFKDIKLNSMSLQSIGAVNPRVTQLQNEQLFLLKSGKITAGDPLFLKYQTAINNAKFGRMGDLTSILATGANIVFPGSGGVVSTLSNLFKNKPNPDDWKGWDAQDARFNAVRGMGAMNWVNQDGDSVENEAANIISYINSRGGVGFILDVNRAFSPAQKITPEKLQTKLTRGGFPEQGQVLANRLRNVMQGLPETQGESIQNNMPVRPRSSSTNTPIFAPDMEQPTVQASGGTSSGGGGFVPLALGGLALFLLLRK